MTDPATLCFTMAERIQGTYEGLRKSFSPASDPSTLKKCFKIFTDSACNVLGTGVNRYIALRTFVQIVTLAEISDDSAAVQSGGFLKQYSSALDGASVLQTTEDATRAIIVAAQQVIRDRTHGQKAESCIAQLMAHKDSKVALDSTNEYTLQTIMNDDGACEDIESRREPGNGNDRIAALCDKGVTQAGLVQALQSQVASLSDSADPNKSVIETVLMCDRRDAIWSTVGDRVYRCKGDVAMWRVIVAYLTGDANFDKATAALLLFFLYFEDVYKGRTSSKATVLSSKEAVVDKASPGTGQDRMKEWFLQKGSKMDGIALPPIFLKK